ncbi:FkbM family methyltransferase [Roseicyclus persicicus]|uniref:FkbM family methyltransferase n=1 Tax=Roseicyclus persicicus TaxID=2650661 RepID=A0A7X6GZL4_9RHOB|nr:FkbM family methyltransferase [Roseibacterium persicicum]NKX45302.1 FkbM family methyltransferase [Roseibacterium persicicum]
MTPSFPHTICCNEHGFYCVPDEFAQKVVPGVLAKGQVYEPRTLNLLRRKAGSGDVVSGGAFVGDFFPALASGLADGAVLWSFEPHPLSFAAAQHTIALNGLDNVRLANVAVGDSRGVLPLEIYDHARQLPAAAASRLVAKGGGEGYVDVEVTRIDDLVPAERRVSILHLDIEGFEQKALTGAARLIRDNAPLIVLEAPTPRRAALYLDQLQAMVPEHGYVLGGALEANSFYVPTA